MTAVISHPMYTQLSLLITNPGPFQEVSVNSWAVAVFVVGVASLLGLVVIGAVPSSGNVARWRAVIGGALVSATVVGFVWSASQVFGTDSWESYKQSVQVWLKDDYGIRISADGADTLLDDPGGDLTVRLRSGESVDIHIVEAANNQLAVVDNHGNVLPPPAKAHQ
ncbi:hypothetical protein ACIRCZ_19530 [Leifsonia sp. NPDC102414]|uniref:hypothetical protein n=1 Tax=Leifsonia sp. NPDC102414 TaxID=3364124 RepID=UPI0038036859